VKKSNAYDHAWRRKRKEILRLNPNCVICGAPADTVDHVISWRFGLDSPLVPMCRSCNSRKGAMIDKALLKRGRGE
jgi:5-methylcytosine-specific restriction endonuclease McrA